MKFAVLQFPGSNCDQDCLQAINAIEGANAEYVWHKENSLKGFDVVVVPGGFSYGDYLRCGAIARFSPIMRSVGSFAADEGSSSAFATVFKFFVNRGCSQARSSETADCTLFASTCTPVSNATTARSQMPHGREPFCACRLRTARGAIFADDAVLHLLELEGRVLLRYCDERGRATETANPNGSRDNIAGICNEDRNVFGLMPHPERACDPLLGSIDGRLIFQSLLEWPASPLRKAA